MEFAKLNFNDLSKSLKNKIYKTIVLPGILNESETWPFTLRDENRLRKFQNSVPRRISGSKKQEDEGWYFFIIYLDCKWVFTRWQWYNKTQYTNNTPHSNKTKHTKLHGQ
jgi:hypothetical protein